MIMYSKRKIQSMVAMPLLFITLMVSSGTVLDIVGGGWLVFLSGFWIFGITAMAGIFFDDPKFRDITEPQDVILSMIFTLIWPITMPFIAALALFVKRTE
jgi:uncharacterized membrane protein YjjP (DUF1212 family)